MVNVQAAVEAWGLERTGFLTLTFADHVVDPVEAQRRMNSLTTHVLRPRYGAAIRIYERQKSGRIHYHLLIPCKADIRTGVDFQALERRDYRSAPDALRSEWSFWRRTAKAYGFGRTELLPIMSCAEAMGRYVGKYIGKHLGARKEADVGVRLVSYVGPRVASVKFAWAGGKGQAWRIGLGELVHALYQARQIHRPTLEAMARRYGKRWAWKWRDIVRDKANGRAAAGATACSGSAQVLETPGEAARVHAGVSEGALHHGGREAEGSEAARRWGGSAAGLAAQRAGPGVAPAVGAQRFARLGLGAA
jgi:hypothetical protein